MDITEHFRAAWVFEASWHDRNLLPTALARAAASVLSADAVAITFMGHQHRMPIGASTPAAAAAERWQFTVGAGPSSAAYEHTEPVLADAQTMQRRWPVLHAQLRRHSPFCAAVILPLGTESVRSGVVELYFTHPHPTDTLDLPAARTVATLIYTALSNASLAAELDAGLGAGFGQVVPATTSNGRLALLSDVQWLDSIPARRRQDVWVAVGICTVALDVSAHDAWAVLRAHAHSLDQTLDDLADCQGPGLMEGVKQRSGRGDDLGRGVEPGLVLDRRDHPQLAVQAVGVVPVDVARDGPFDVVEAAPRTVTAGLVRVADALGFEQRVECLGHRVVVGVAGGADRGDRTFEG